MSDRISLGKEISVELPRGWSDMTSDVGPGAPYTVAADSGVGALQFSIATYRDGAVPHVTIADLRKLQEQFASSHNLGRGSDRIEADKPLRYVASSYRSGDDFVRMWHMSDGVNVALGTYVCDAAVRSSAEVKTAEAIIKTLQFKTAA